MRELAQKIPNASTGSRIPVVQFAVTEFHDWLSLFPLMKVGMFEMQKLSGYKLRHMCTAIEESVFTP